MEPPVNELFNDMLLSHLSQTLNTCILAMICISPICCLLLGNALPETAIRILGMCVYVCGGGDDDDDDVGDATQGRCPELN